MVSKTVYWAKWSGGVVFTTKGRLEQPGYVYPSYGLGNIYPFVDTARRSSRRISTRAIRIYGHVGILYRLY
jgi:hypothetical protein